MVGGGGVAEAGVSLMDGEHVATRCWERCCRPISAQLQFGLSETVASNRAALLLSTCVVPVP